MQLGGGGSQADWSQNDESAADYVKNRPGGYTITTPGYEITWDGVVGDKVVVDGGRMQFVKVSDRVFTVEELIGATVVIANESIVVDEESVWSQGSIISIGADYVLVCATPGTAIGVTIPETGTYFLKAEDRFTSLLRKPDATTTVKIPAELTTVVGGYDVAERTAVIFDGTVKASDFTKGSVGASYYDAPIALTEDLVEGATVSGTINGVQVSGTVEAGRVNLYKLPGDSSKVAEIGGDAGNYEIALEKQPESDLTIHLTQTIPAHAVTIPEEYLELTETNAAIETAQNTANTAQNTANTAQNTANTAQNAADIAAVTALILTITWDGTTIGKTTFTTSKAEKFYKVSSLEIPVRAFVGTYKNNNTTVQKLRPVEHDGWYRDSNTVIVVLNPGTYAADALVGSFTASEPGVYLRDANASPYVLNISSEPDVYYNAMFMMSDDGTKKFCITVDDTGTIKATEVTNN